MKHQDIDTKAKAIAQKYKACETELLEIIIYLDAHKTYRHWGYGSLFSYVITGLELSAAIASNFIAVARKSHIVPELKAQVLSGKLSIHQARKITPVITSRNQKLWLERAKTQSSRQLEREVALAKPETAIHERLSYVAAADEVTEKVSVKTAVSRTQLQLGVSEKTMLQFRRAQDLECQRQKRNVGLEETLDRLLDCYLKKNDPVEKAKRQKVRGKLSEGQKADAKTLAQPAIEPIVNRETNADASANVSRDTFKLKSLKGSSCSRAQASGASKRKPIPAMVRHQVQLRDGGRCCFKDHQGRRCTSGRYLEVHHIKEVAHGGLNTLENLITLCSGHHAAQHLSRPNP